MAAVVTTTTIVAKHVFGDKRAHLINFAYDTGDYAAGGVAVTAAQCGLQAIEGMFFEGVALEVAATPTANLPRWNPTTSKIQYFQSAAADAPFAEKGAEAFGAGATVRAWVIGH
jgi:hypothetical protein